MIRATLAILLCVFAAMARPETTGGHHDLLAFGVLVDDRRGGEELRLAPLDAEALAGFDAMVRSPLGPALLQGPEVVAACGLVPSRPGETEPVVGVVYFGRATRSPRVTVRFRPAAEPDGSSPGFPAMLHAAYRAAAAPPAVSAAAARTLLRSDDLASLRDAFAVLERCAPATAAVEAQRLAGTANPLHDGPLSHRRELAVRVLRRLGGRAVWPALFTRLAEDGDAPVAAAAAEE
jgi:hypothetical protein